ncbi:DMT family transporter [Agarilytica rhodophyticola]|uniref:DMT family transporter n=1 Tax=Agarilytica rhodophyticola TaxID=1737490 RepID=UPI000B347CF3|nr:DMT family transporter [Agarilytica rhodophyticola]
MKVGMAYFCVVMIWSTTPLGIKWSNSSLSFTAAIASRIFFALCICLLLLAVLRRRLPLTRSDLRVYFAGVIGVFPNMLIVYWSARYIPSGLASVIFGLYPFMVGFFSYFILKENVFDWRRVLALGCALLGLGVVNIDQFNMGGNALYGALGMLSSTILFGLSSVWLKRIGANMDPLQQTSGVLLFAAPLFILSWCLFDGEVPQAIDQRSLIGISYLVICGSVLGGMLFFYVLKNCSVASVGVIMLITPIFSLCVGTLVDDEKFSLSTILGCGLIIFSLAIYQNLFKYAKKYLFSRWRFHGA